MQRLFRRQLFPLLFLDQAPHHFIHMNAGASTNLIWWRLFLQGWNGISFFPAMATSVEIFSDVSGHLVVGHSYLHLVGSSYNGQPTGMLFISQQGANPCCAHIRPVGTAMDRAADFF